MTLNKKRNFDDSNLSDNLAGKLEFLQMTNFMCHSNLELRFNPLINFITGKNGSGKSAIMAALIIALGGTASLTGRGSGIAEFVKKEQNWAKVSITLINEGINSYKKDLYGSRITISRTILKNGQTSYACKSECGNTISKKKEEVDNIILAFNWQIRNPICMLSQDIARSFLCSTDNEMKFTLFVKATQLEQLKTIYLQTMELLALTKGQLQVKVKAIEEARNEILQLKEKLEIFTSLEKHVIERRNLENEYLWALVVEEENRMELLSERKRNLDDKAKSVTDKMMNLDSLINKSECETQEYVKRLEEIKFCINEKISEKFREQKKVQELDKEVLKCESQLNQALSKMESLSSDITGVKEHLKRCDPNSDENQSRKMRQDEVLASLEKNLSDVREKLGEKEKDFCTVQKAMVHETALLKSLESELNELENNKRRLDVLMKNGRTISKTDYLKYGRFTQAIVEAIDEAAKRNAFHKKPVGPCGMYVNLTGDLKWARAVEFVVGNLMTSYCCDNKKDFQTLSHIMNRVCRHEQHPNIIIGRFLLGRHNLESRKVRIRNHPSILDVLTFESDVVFNTFVDQAQIECIALFETDKQAAALMTHIENVPSHLLMGLTVACDQYYPAPNYRTYAGKSTRRIAFFDKIVKSVDSMKNLEADLVIARNSMEERNLEINKIRKKHADLEQTADRFERNIVMLRTNERKIFLKLKQLKDAEDTRPVAITKVALEDELQILTKNYEELCEKTKEKKEALESLKVKKNEDIKKLNELATEEKVMEENLRQLEERLEQKKQMQGQLSSQKRRTEVVARELNNKLKEVADEILKCQGEIEDRMRQAEDVCPGRVDTNKEPAVIQKLLEKCERYLKAAEKLVGSKEETIKSYKAKMELFKNMKKMAGILEGTMETLLKATHNKLERLEILQTHTANLVSFHFQAALQTRGYDGQLKIDFGTKMLELEVAPKDSVKVRKDTKTLSGGERSYSTVSFILAIWKVVNMPVYFLDEFDVFMDKVNRKVMMDLLLEHASAQMNKQFVFITPQDISGIQVSDEISVYRLPDPERRDLN